MVTLHMHQLIVVYAISDDILVFFYQLNVSEIRLRYWERKRMALSLKLLVYNRDDL